MQPLIAIGGLALGAAAVGAARRAASAEAGSALLDKLRAMSSVMGRARGGPTPDVWRLLQHRPAILLGVVAYELALVASNRVDSRLKVLAGLKAAALVGCPYWLDIASAVGRELGVTEAQLLDLPRYQESPAFTPVERLVLDLAVHLTAQAPVPVPDALLAQLRAHFDDAQLVELVAAIAWENYRSRFNRAFDVRAVGYSHGAFCALPERAASGGTISPTPPA